MRILHVTESLGGGVEAAVADIIDAAEDHEHLLCYVSRDQDRIDSPGLQRARGLPAEDGHRRRIGQVSHLVERENVDLVWAHSSFAGLYARVRTLPVPVVYTPHCFGFLRTDLPVSVRAAIWATERALSPRTAVFAACGQAEADLARRFGGPPLVLVVPNRAPAVTNTDHTSKRSGPIVGMGRVCPQKGVDFFIKVVTEARSRGVTSPFIWIGDGDTNGVRALREHGVEVTGWLPRSQAIRHLSVARAYVHCAAWEGSPLTVLEAAAHGVPIAGRSNRSLTAEGVTLLGSDPVDVAAIVCALENEDEHVIAAAERTNAHLISTHRRDDQVAAIRLMLETIAAQQPTATWDVCL